jgi:hypothetical protein
VAQQVVGGLSLLPVIRAQGTVTLELIYWHLKSKNKYSREARNVFEVHHDFLS